MRSIAEPHLEHYSIWSGIINKPLEWLAILISLYLSIPPMVFPIVLVFFFFHPFFVLNSVSAFCIFSFVAIFLVKKQSFKIDGLFLLFIPLTIFGTVSGIMGIDFSKSLKAVIGLYFLPLFYLMMINMVDTREKVRWILRIIIFAVALQAVIGMIEFILGIQLFSDPTVKGTMDTIKIGSVEKVRVSGSWDPTYFGAIMVGSIPITLSMIHLRGEKIKLKVVYLITFVLSILGLIFSFSKGAMISFLGLALYGLSKGLGKRMTTLFPILVGLIFVFGILYSINFPVVTTWIDTVPRLIVDLNPENINFSSPKAISAAFRWVHVRESLKMILLHPLLGVGPGNSIIQMGQQNVHPYYIGNVHNNVLLVASEYGLIVLGFYICLIFMVWKNFLEVEKMARRNKDVEITVLAISLRASLLAFLIAFQLLPIAFNLNVILLCTLSGAIKKNILKTEPSLN